MIKTKLTVRVDQDLLEKLKKYATKNNTTLTDLIDSYLRNIPAQERYNYSPIVKRLSGILSSEITVQDYKKHLEEKYAK
ncbi:MAG: DUF6364 family protein [Chloroflexi bacterium]|nr:DUF6364 family protein [Chloroflexota bacterium]